MHRALAAKGQAVDGVAYGVHYNAVIDGAGSNATARALANAIHTERKGDFARAGGGRGHGYAAPDD